MLDVALSPDTSGPPILDSFRACLSSVLEIPLGEVPQHEDSLRAAVGQWRTWLAGRGVGLVPIAHASRFQWPGYWIAVLAGDARVHGTDGCADVRLAVRRRSQPTEFGAAGASCRRSPGSGGLRHRPLRPCVERRFDEASAPRLGRECQRRGHSDRGRRRGAHAANDDCTGDPGPRPGRRPIRQPGRHLHPSQRARQRLRPDTDRS